MHTDIKTRIITMTDRAPVEIIEDYWPLVAAGFDHDGETEAYADRRWRVNVRQHSDGRTLVYGTYLTALTNDNDVRAGYLVSSADTVDTIRKVATEIGGKEYLARTCIADLPPERI